MRILVTLVSSVTTVISMSIFSLEGEEPYFFSCRKNFDITGILHGDATNEKTNGRSDGQKLHKKWLKVSKFSTKTEESVILTSLQHAHNGRFGHFYSEKYRID